MPDLWKYYRAQSDTDAETFFAACVTAGTTLSAGQKTAIYNLVGSLKWASLWSKMTALYPFIGGTAATHAINLKSPGTYNIQNAANATWTGMTHNSNGVTGNGSTTYGDTGLVPSSVLSLTSCHLSAYLRTNTTESKAAIGSLNNTTSRFYTYPLYSSSISTTGLGSGTEKQGTIGGPGLTVATKTAANSFKVFLKSRVTAISTLSDSALPTISAYICGMNYSSVESSNRNFAFFSIGSGLTDSDAANLSAFVQSYQTALGRAV